METLYQAGDVIRDKYRIINILGQGGTATTYEAKDIIRDRTIAIKVLSLHQTMEWKIIELFEREATVLANIDHPHIPKYIDYFHLDLDGNRVFFLVQELIPGKSLANLVKEGWYFQESEIKNIAEQLLTILDYLHHLEPPVIHRDIKPHNIIRTDEGEIYLVDLGAVQDVYRNTLTRSGTFVGTIDYMSPEQMRGQACYASDLYSLGCTLLYLLTRRSPVDLPLQRMKIDFRNCLSISPQFADWLEVIIEPAVENRFQSTTEALKALKRKSNVKREIFNESIPAGSRVKLHKTKDELSIKIHPAILQNYGEFSYARLLIPIMIPILYWIVSFAYNIFLEEGLIVTIFLCWFWCALAIFITLGIGYFLKSYNLKINRDNFTFRCNLVGLVRTRQGQTSYLRFAKIQKVLLFDDMKPIANCCTIKIKGKKYLFGSWLILVEKEWIAAEITEFISKINQNY